MAAAVGVGFAVTVVFTGWAVEAVVLAGMYLLGRVIWLGVQ